MAKKSSKGAGHTTKVVTLRHHHAKAYRKRHIGLLVFCSVILIVLIGIIVDYRVQVATSLATGSSFVSDLLGGSKAYDTKVHSTLGYTLTYDQRDFYASGIDATNGDLFLGNDLSQNRAYSVVRLTPSLVSGQNIQSAQSSLTLTYHHETTYKAGYTPSLDSLQDLAFSDGLITGSAFTKTGSDNQTIDGHTFLKSTWVLNAATGITSKIKSEIVSYVGVVNNQPVTIIINYGLGGSTTDSPYDSVISSLIFGDQEQAFVPQSSQVVASVTAHRSFMDSVLFTNFAAAADGTDTTDNSEKVAALYGPAVVKIYNAYCMDISVHGQPFIKDACSGVSGSGFFVSQDGYIATNGHVADQDPKNIVIQDALAELGKGDESYFDALISLTSLTDADVAGLDQPHASTVLVNALYGISDSEFTTTNSISYLTAALSTKEPDTTELVNDMTARKAYPAQDTIENAKEVAVQYRAVDGPDWGLTGFNTTDVAILKIDGTNFPVTKLGSIDEAVQGANLMILGFPGNATDNGLVDSTDSTVTLTSGKVSSVKNAAGSDKKLIETDTTIGHGNSGGPVLVDNGDVVGIATYTSDGSGTGNGVFNYVRDIKDIKDLAASSSITFDTNSETQQQWEQGINYFYIAHYSKALVYFNKVKALYPSDSRVDEFIAAATQRIKDGKDIQDFPIIPVAIGGGVLLLGIGAAIFLIVRHKKHHAIYKDKVAQGAIAPMTPGAAPQQVMVTPPQVTPMVPAAPSEVSESTSTPTAPAKPLQQPSTSTSIPVSKPVSTPTSTPSDTPKMDPWFGAAPNASSEDKKQDS